MARRNAQGHLSGRKVRLKKYFYVLRPLLAIRYIEDRGDAPPVKFEELVEAAAPANIIPAIANLLRLKRETPELGLGDPIREIGHFVETELAGIGSHSEDRGVPTCSPEWMCVKS